MAVHAEALLIYQSDKSAREMLYSEFNALLDGMVTADQFAGQTLEAVYLQLDEQLQIRALVFFLLPFNQQGQVAEEWNLPLRDMAARGRPGPTLKGTPTRLLCRSQCPEKWHAWLWEPHERYGRDPFDDILRVLRRNRLGLLPASVPAPPEPPAAEQSEAAEVPLITDVQASTSGQRRAQEELARLRTREQQLRHKVSSLQVQLNKATRRADELETANQKLRDHIRTLKAQFDRLRSRVT